MRSLTILGSTGSIGTQALDVVRRNPDRFKVVGLSAAGMNQELLVGQIREFLPPFVAIADEEAAARRQGPSSARSRGSSSSSAPTPPRSLAREDRGRLRPERARRVAPASRRRSPRCRPGKTLALANKESLVVGGELVMDLVKGEPERLLAGRLRARGARDGAPPRAPRGPQAGRDHRLRRSVPRLDPQRARSARRVKEALQHPVWSMGPKITIDSATLMNKGLEVIEAHYLFDLDYSQIHVLDPPGGASCTRMAEFRDGSLRAEMATADMRLPIQLALAWPERLPDRRRAGPAHRSAAHLRAGRSRSLPGGRPRLPRRRSRAHVPGGDERRERGRRHGLPGGEDPAHAHRRDRADGGRRARARLDRLGREHRACRRVGARTARPRSSRSASARGVALAIVAVLRRAVRDHHDPRGRALPAGARGSGSGCSSTSSGSARGSGRSAAARSSTGVKAIPAGGYVKIAGMNPFENDVPAGRRGIARTARSRSGSGRS